MWILLTPLNLYYTFQLLIGGNAVKRIPVVSDMLEILLCLVVRMEECEGVAVEEEPRPPPPDPRLILGLMCSGSAGLLSKVNIIPGPGVLVSSVKLLVEKNLQQH